ncbi:iron-sulfur cluster carrier protein [Nocardia neocaledoniensis NBRC 108232]|uniref:Iron-sulfur cluster carrier protein n=1 Tax=Nocardia neocaledoniensis TaxID=236511 RepID=A0A317N2T7_9NOCA|nr:Mrp/NBP35 family ATP-binding protein [Nocardia neocaledoniensis]PWV68880.1 ATP-binding protein involved in chromosome partitioning [Nocardia neocaledoniensis]GEM34871.1 iron-sulfur cluster carrier protein [Nocardia neocaledoniensis NBRC 108232]
MPRTTPTPPQVVTALDAVHDPEIGRPLTELDMIDAVEVDARGHVEIRVLLTVAACPLRATISADIRAAVTALPGVTGVDIDFGVMSEGQRQALRLRLRGPAAEAENGLTAPDTATRVYCVVSGKGGVGKSSVTVNLAVALARRGLRVGVMDADVHGHSVPAMLGITTAPTVVERMLMPPTAFGIRVISIGMFAEGNAPVIWRGPMLHRALGQFVHDVYWGELDVLLIDMPPGTGDIAISLAQLLPAAELLVVTTPQRTAARIAERAGAVAAQTGQRVAGIVENMSWYDASDGTRHTPFGAGGATAVSRALSVLLDRHCPVLGRIPFDPVVCVAGDDGVPFTHAAPESAPAHAIADIAAILAPTGGGLTGRRLPVTPMNRTVQRNGA